MYYSIDMNFFYSKDNLVALHFKYDQARRRFVEWAQNEIAVVPDFHKLILFSDEAHFWLNGYVNKQKCRIWSEANPQVYVETPLHPEKLTSHVTTNFFIPELKNHDVQELWFQQDGATCHTARVTIDLLKDTFGDRLISHFGPVSWPPRSCDLTPLDYFLWGYVKSLVYVDKPQTLDHLENNIRRVIADIRPQMLEKVIENWTSRLDYIRASRGSHMPKIIFKMENLSAYSISNYDCFLSPFFIPHPSERNAINIVRFSDKSTEDFTVICYTDGSKIDGRVGFAFVVFRSGVESENFQFRIRDECTVFVAEIYV
ncbi:transposable element Tc3 transposase [Trichonephila clavipes]|nr:transposable element Tc3 transposase [Trichonephila clavipes]